MVVMMTDVKKGMLASAGIPFLCGVSSKAGSHLPIQRNRKFRKKSHFILSTFQEGSLYLTLL